MGLSFAAPLALGFAALVALPIIAHLARQVPKERVPFGAMLLLERVTKRLRRRARLKDPLVLLLRAIMITAIALAVAGAVFTWQGGLPEAGGSGRVVIIVDRSMSMDQSDRGSTLLQRAREDAIEAVQAMPPGTLVAAVTYSSRAERLVPVLTDDHERVIAKLAELEPTAGRSDLRAALVEARALLGGETGEVLVFTDEAGAENVGTAVSEIGLLVAGGSSLIPHPIHADPPRNVAPVSAEYGEGPEGGSVTVRIANYGPDPIEVACEVTLPDGQAIPVFVQMPGNGEAEEQVTVPPEVAGGVGKAWCDDPDLSLDDARYFHVPRVGASRVLVVDGDPGDTPTKSEVYFLERALSPWGGMRGGVRPEVVTAKSLLTLDPERNRVVFLANVGDPRAFGPALVDFVRRGGSVVITMGDNVTAERYNSALGAILPANFDRVRDLATAGELGTPLDLPGDDPLFAPFSRGGRGGFTKVRAKRVMRLEPYAETDEVRTLLTWEGGTPALVERTIGKGHVLVWTSTIDLGWNNLPLQAIYMPLVQRIVGELGAESGGGEGRYEAEVGETVAIPLPDLAIEPAVLGPDGEAVRSRIEGSELKFEPTAAGSYAVQVEDAPPIAFVAVNTPPEESDVRRYDSLARAEQEIAPELFQKRLDLSPWLFAAALVSFVLQALIGARNPGNNT